MKNRSFALILAVTLILSLSGCGGKTGLPTSQTAGRDFQKNMHQSLASQLRTVCETDGGFYFMGGRHWQAYYLDKAAKRAILLCGKPECSHEEDTCDADLSAQTLWFYDGRLYFTNANSVEENGEYVDYGNRVYSVAPDGTGRKVAQDLEFEPNGDQANAASPILHRGTVYFSYNGDLYAMPLGGDIRDAEKIWGQELPEVETDQYGIPVLGAHYLSYDLWADGDSLYFMTDLKLADGTYKAALFALDTDTHEATQLWKTPDKEETGDWDTAGVSPTQWYILDGVLYFYLSGNGLWRTDLSSGETKKLVDTGDVAPHGTAIFSDDYLCVLNDGLDRHEIFSYSDSTGHTGGDTLYIYGLDGELKGELDLKSLYDELDPLNHIQLAFCSGDEVYFLADATRQGGLGESTQVGDVMGSAMKQYRKYVLYCVSISTGEITEIDTWQW